VSIEEVQYVSLDPTLEVSSFSRIISCRFTLPVAADVRLEIYDASGRRVHVLASARFASGVHELHWFGTDDEDNRCASGLYFVRLLVHGKEPVTGRLILL
jgi:flagellar hook assembly protein FlgD